MAGKRFVDEQQGKLDFPVEQHDLIEVEMNGRSVDEDMRLNKALFGRAAFMGAMFPGYYGISESELLDAQVPIEAFRESNPAVIRGHVHEFTSQSMRQFQKSGRWVLLTAVEHSAIIDYPEKYAQRVDNRNRTTQPSLYREHDERVQVARRAGAHALEDPLNRMKHVSDEYARQIRVYRNATGMIKNHWHANSVGYAVRHTAITIRENLRAVLEAVAETSGWSQEDLRFAQLGLDKRLMSGRGEQALRRKKAAWSELTRTIGNYTIDKKVLVDDRVKRSAQEIDIRLHSENKQVDE